MKRSLPILLLIILFVGAAWYSLTREPELIHELPPPQLQPAAPITEQPSESAVTVVVDDRLPVPEPLIVPDPLPLLEESDPEVTLALVGALGAEPLAEYLVKNQAISRFVASVDSLTSRQVPALINPIKPADEKFIVDTEGDSMTMSAQNFARYDGHVAVLQNVDADALMVLYQRYYPLFQQAWEENGGEGSFNERLIAVIDQLLATPDIPGLVYLTKPEAVYLFTDPELEALTAGQKILVRMGSVNASVVKDKLAEFRAELNP